MTWPVSSVHSPTLTRILAHMNRVAVGAAGCLTLGMALGCQPPAAVGGSEAARCDTEDVLASVGQAANDPRIAQDAAWLRRAQVCNVGPFVFAVPRDPGVDAIYVLRKGKPARPVFLESATSHTTVLFDVNGDGRDVVSMNEEIALVSRESRRVLASDHHPKSGTPSFTYAAYDASRRAWIEYIDSGRDGTFDIRQTDVEGQPRRQEATVGDRWLDMVQRDGKTGVVFDGRFMSLQDARASVARHVEP